MEVSFSGGETLKRDNVRVEDDRLNFFLFSFLFFIFLLIDLGLEFNMTFTNCYMM